MPNEHSDKQVRVKHKGGDPWLEFEKEKDKYWRNRTETKRRDEMYIHGVRALLLLNGGGAVALLAFLGQVWGNSKSLPPGIIHGMSYLVVGCGIAGVIHFLRYETSLHWKKTVKLWNGKYNLRIGKCLSILSIALVVASILCFLWGLKLVIAGAISHFP